MTRVKLTDGGSVVKAERALAAYAKERSNKRQRKFLGAAAQATKAAMKRTGIDAFTVESPTCADWDTSGRPFANHFRRHSPHTSVKVVAH